MPLHCRWGTEGAAPPSKPSTHVTRGKQGEPTTRLEQSRGSPCRVPCGPLGSLRPSSGTLRSERFSHDTVFFFCTFFTLAPSQAWSGTFRGYVTCDTTLTKCRNRIQEPPPPPTSKTTPFQATEGLHGDRPAPPSRAHPLTPPASLEFLALSTHPWAWSRPCWLTSGQFSAAVWESRDLKPIFPLWAQRPCRWMGQSLGQTDPGQADLNHI